MIEISIVIITCDRNEDLEKLLVNLVEIGVNPSSEIIIVDASCLGSFARNSKFISSLRINAIHISARRNRSLQRNIGISISKGEYVLFLDDDVILDSDYFCNIVKCFKEEGVIGAAGFVKNQKNYPLIEGLFRKMFLLLDVNNKKTYMKSSGYFSFLNKRPKCIVHTIALWGCNMIVKRKILEKCNFDENLSYYGDIELSCRLLEFGKLIFSGEAMLIHNRSVLSREPPWMIIGRQAVSSWYIFRKYNKWGIVGYGAFIWSSMGVFILIVLSYIFKFDFTKGLFKEYEPY